VALFLLLKGGAGGCDVEATMTSGKVETAERPLVPPTASSAMQRFWAEFRARTTAVYTSLRPAPPRERKATANHSLPKTRE